MKNDYEIRGETTEIIVEHAVFGRKECLISTNKLEKANSFPGKWFLNRMKNTLYVYGAIKRNRRTKMYALHRWITDAPEKMVVDHIDHDPLNNTDENLRIVTIAQNVQNRKGATRVSKSGYRNVNWFKPAKMWAVKIKVAGKEMHFGYFKDVEEANQIAIEARKQYMPFSNESA